ncbi:MAG: hypothetical protein SF053_06350 [Bacteroidia bacterium]|nr:hypothetical protein [Bacteroidia bacterium]
MSPEELRKLKREVAQLRQENQQLKAASTHPVHTMSSAGADAHRPDVLVASIGKWLAQLKSANRALTDVATQLREAERSLTTLLPALDLQVNGWKREIENLRQTSEQAEADYTEVVMKLESKLQQVRRDTHTQEQKLRDAYEATLAALRDEKAQLQIQLEQQQRPDKPDPTTPFTIFEP